MASAAEQLRQEGIEQGHIRTLRSTLTRQLLLRFKLETLDTSLQARIAAAGTAELESWIDRVVTVERIEDVFEP